MLLASQLTSEWHLELMELLDSLQRKGQNRWFGAFGFFTGFWGGFWRCLFSHAICYDLESENKRRETFGPCRARWGRSLPAWRS